MRHTSRGADLVIVVGDFNLEPEDLGMRFLYLSSLYFYKFRLILANTRLLDAWRLCHQAASDSCQSLESCRGMGKGATCDRTDNYYTSRSHREKVRNLSFAYYFVGSKQKDRLHFI